QVDEESDPGDDEDHHRAESVNAKRQVDREGPHPDPGIEAIGKRAARRQAPQASHRRRRHHEGEQHRRWTHDAGDPWPVGHGRRHPHDGAEQGEQRDPAEQTRPLDRHRLGSIVYQRSRPISSALTVRRCAKIARMMASPTATPAAGVVTTKKTITCPSTAPALRARATKVTLTAFSISSIDISMTITFRRKSTPKAPIAKRTAARTR